MWQVNYETTNLTPTEIFKNPLIEVKTFAYLFIYLFIYHLDKRCYQRLELDVKLKMRDDKTVEILLLICKQLPSLIWNSKTKTSTYFLINNTLS